MTDHVCPICFSTDFLDFNTRPKVRCAGCGSMERGRLAWMVLSRLGLMRPGVRMLNFAPEPFMLTIGRQIIGETYEAADYSPAVFGQFAPSIRKIDICRDLPTLDQRAYDVVMHNHVLEHVQCNVEQALRRIHHLVRLGGWHVFSIPIFPNRKSEEDLSPDLPAEERARRFDQSDHMRVFGSDFMTTIEAAGLASQLCDTRDLISIADLSRWAVPVEALDGASPHRIFAAQAL